MTTNIFWRLAWKEYRQQRDLLLAMGLIALALLAMALAWAWLEGQPLSTDMAYHIAFMMPVFYVLGCAAMLFAGEHERDTFGFLRALPLRSREVFWPKAVMAIGSTLLLTVVLVLVAALITQFRPLKTPSDIDLLANYFLVMAEALVWIMLFSQLLKHPFWAMAAGGIAYLASWMGIAFLGALTVHVLGLSSGDLDFTIFIALRCAIVLLLATINVALGTKWLERDRIWMPSLAGPAVEEMAPAPGPATRQMMLGRLWWQSLRESGWIFAAIYGALMLWSVLIMLNQGPPGVVWGCLPALIGSFTFFQDHWKQHYRFFSERGISARTLWWGRILASLTACLPWLAVMVATIATGRESVSTVGLGEMFHFPVDMLVLAVFCFAWGQWCSLVFRSGMIGLFAGVALSLGLLFVMAILRFLGIPDWLGIYLPAAILLWASWYRAPDWLAERNSWRRWFAYAGTLAVPLVLYLAGIAAHRAYEIPQIVDSSSYVAGPGGVNIPTGIATQHAAALAALQRPATNEELETARLYRELWTELRQLPPPDTGAGMAGMSGSGGTSAGPPGAAEADSSATASAPEAAVVDKDWEAKLARLVEQFVEISRRADASFSPDPLVAMQEDNLLLEFRRASVHVAHRLDEAEEHDAALERYLALIRLARHYQQQGDYQRINVAVQSLGGTYESLLSRAVRIKQSKESLLAMQATLDTSPYDFTPDYEVAWLRYYLVFRNGLNHPYLKYLPWERERARRWIDYTTLLSRGENLGAVPQLIQQWQANTFAGALVILQPEALRYESQTRLNVQRSALDLRLMLLAYKAEHGELPETLEILEGQFPGQVKPDPTTQRSWIYRPHGVAGDPALEKPFVWSALDRSGVWSLANDVDLATHGQVFVVEPNSAE